MIRPLDAADAAAFQPLRLRGLRESPEAFGSTYEEEAAAPLAEIAARLARGAEGEDMVFGALDGEGVLVLEFRAHGAGTRIAFPCALLKKTSFFFHSLPGCDRFLSQREQL